MNIFTSVNQGAEAKSREVMSRLPVAAWVPPRPAGFPPHCAARSPRDLPLHLTALGLPSGSPEPLPESVFSDSEPLPLLGEPEWFCFTWTLL